MNNKSLLAIIFILLIGIGGYMYLTTPSIDIDDFSVEKYVITTKYESGKTDKDYYIDQIEAHRYINAHVGKRKKEIELLIMNYNFNEQ